MVFPESDNAESMAQAAAAEMQDDKGNRLELHRDRDRNLTEIEAPNHHWVRFKYDDETRVKRADDDAGEWVLYDYDKDGYLMDVIHSTGEGRHYTLGGQEDRRGGG